MLCFRDMTFCDYKNCKKWKECHRALTEKEIKKAEKWWGDDKPPISMYAEEPECLE